MYKKLIFLAASATTFALPAHSDDQSVIELEPVIVTAPLQQTTAVPVTVLEDDELTMKMGHTIGETLKQEQGVSQDVDLIC